MLVLPDHSKPVFSIASAALYFNMLGFNVFPNQICLTRVIALQTIINIFYWFEIQSESFTMSNKNIFVTVLNMWPVCTHKYPSVYSLSGQK